MHIIEIVNYCEADLDAVCRLLNQLSPDCPVPTEEHYKKVLESDNSHLFLIKDDGVIAGMLTISFYDIPTARRAWIEDVVVDTKFRGKKLGRSLVAHALEFAKSNNATSVMLTSNPKRIAANELYRSFGFRLKETNTYIFEID